MNSIECNYWVFKTVSDGDRSYQSHTGYDDILKSRYVYDSNVANSKQVKSNDLIVLVNKKRILGFAKISRIESYKSTKEIGRCPVCGNTTYEARKTKTPEYRCNKGHEFDQPKKKIVNISKYEACYEGSFIEPKTIIPVSVLKEHFNRRYNRNMSMQSIDPDFFKNVQKGLFRSLSESTTYLSAEDADSNEVNQASETYSPTTKDEREKVLRQIKIRRGQQKFRKQLIDRYNSKCCITGCSILHILEAAHINPYKGPKNNHASNGLLLRADIHTLFDLDMLGIHPQRLTIHLNNKVKKDKYEELEGATLKGKPSKEALKIKWNLFIKNR